MPVISEPAPAAPVCRLCGSGTVELFWQDTRRDYYRCGCCRLVFVPPQQLPGASEEKAEYDLHRNDPQDPGYRRFLGRLFEPLQARLAAGSEGLDFGCGPGPALAMMLAEAGHGMTVYDSFYAPDRSVLQRRYDFITATEVVEHLHRPGEELRRLWALLRPGGVLGLMTKLVLDREAFSRWHYKNDLTHVSFFSQETFTWLACELDARLEVIGKDVILLIRCDSA
jgi:SAM-dependent methyltransferase